MNRPSEILVAPLRPVRRGSFLRTAALYLAVGVLLALALRGVPFGSIWETLRALSLWQIGGLLLINCAVVITMTLRWWLVVRAEKPRLPFLPFIASRLAVFGVSYFTVGPQLGGEPLQVLYLRREHNQTFARAVSTVIMDKLLELLGNFIFLALGLFAFLRLGLFDGNALPAWAWVLLAVPLGWPVVHILLMRRGIYPVSLVLKALLPGFQKHRWMRVLSVSEHLAGSFTRRHPGYLLGALGASLICWLGMGAEYWLILHFLQVHTDIWQSLFALNASLLAFLLPLPGGLGALEASQVLALGSLGFPAAAAVSATLLMRARDLLNGGIGLLLAARLLRK